MAARPPIEVAATQSGLHPAVRAIVLDALARGTGQTLSTNAHFRERLGLGAGTIQRALDLLEERDALRTVSRGHLGRRIESLAVGGCWQAAGLPAVRILLSPSGPAEHDVLEALLADRLTALGIPHTVRHARGGNGRLVAVSEGAHDIAVVSAGTLDGAASTLALHGLGATRRYPSGTYYATDRLVVLTGPRPGTGPARVAIDRQSFDHHALTVAEFVGSDVEYVDVPFTDVPAYVLAGIVDTGVWHVTASPVPLWLTGLRARPLGRPEAARVRDTLSGAALVASARRPELNAVVAALPLDDLQRLQAAAIDADAAGADELRRISSEHADVQDRT